MAVLDRDAGEAASARPVDRDIVVGPGGVRSLSAMPSTCQGGSVPWRSMMEAAYWARARLHRSLSLSLEQLAVVRFDIKQAFQSVGWA